MTFIESRKMTAGLLTVSKSFCDSMHSNVYEQCLFKLGMMKDTSEHYILILVYAALILIQGHGSTRK